MAVTCPDEFLITHKQILLSTATPVSLDQAQPSLFTLFVCLPEHRVPCCHVAGGICRASIEGPLKRSQTDLTLLHSPAPPSLFLLQQQLKSSVNRYL